MSDPHERKHAAGDDAGAAPSRSALPLMLLIAVVCGALSVGSALVGGTHATAPESPWVWALTFLSLSIVLGGGAAIGPLLWATPTVEPSALKLGLFSSLLSPGLVAGLHAAVLFGGAGLGLAVSVPAAWAITFAVLGVGSLLGVRSRLSTASPGRAAGLACFFGLVAAAFVLHRVQGDAGLAARLDDRGTVAMATLARSFQTGAPFAQPWTAGLALDLRPAMAVVLAAVAGPAQASPLVAGAWLVAWSVAVLAVAGYLASAALFRECRTQGAGLRDVVASVALPVVCWSGYRGSWSASSWLSAAVTSGVLVAGLHAVRRGARPWPGLAASLLCVLGALHPLSAFGLAVALAISGAIAGRWMLLPLVGFALLPGVLQGRLFGGFGFDPSAPFVSDRLLADTGSARLLEAAWQWLTGPLGAVTEGQPVLWLPLILLSGAGLVTLALALAGGRGAASGSVPGSDPLPGDRRASRMGACLLLLAWLTPLVLVVWLPSTARGEGVHLVGAGLVAVSVALGRLAQLFGRGRAGLVVGAAVLGGLAFPAPIAAQLDGDGGRNRGPRSAPFEESLAGLELSDAIPMQVGLGEAALFLRRSKWVRDPKAVLLREPGTPGPVMRNERLSLAPLLFQIPLFGARVPSPGADQTRWLAPALAPPLTELGDHPRDRLELLEALFEREGIWHPRFDRILKRMRERGHALVFLVSEADRRATTDRGTGPRGVDGVITRLGAEAVFEGPEVTVYVLPPENGSADDTADF